MPKFITLLTAGLAASFFASASAKAEVTELPERFEWEYGKYNDDMNRGLATSTLSLRIPETDATAIYATCVADYDDNSSLVKISGDTTGRQDDEATSVTFYHNSAEHTFKGTVTGTQAEEGISGVELEVGNDDPLWESLSAWLPIGYRLLGEDVQVMSGGAAPHIESFLRDCRFYADENSK